MSPLHRAAHLVLSTMIALSAGQATAGPYCRDYNPSIHYLSVRLPEKLRLAHIPDGFDDYRAQNPEMAKNLPPYVRFSVEAIKYASINNFVEQLPIAVLAGDSPFLRRLSVMPIDRAVIDAMGLGGVGTRIIEPGSGLASFSDLDVEVVDVDGIVAGSDTPNFIFVSRNLVERIVRNAVDRHFGGVAKFEDHLKRILAMTDLLVRPLDRPEPTNYQNFASFRVDSQDNSRFPIGQVIDSASSGPDSNPYKQLKEFAREVAGELVFIGAHEVGHLRLGHHNLLHRSCRDFTQYEREADAYAAQYLADFQFNMAPMTDTIDVPTMADFAAFFDYYKQSGFTDDDNETDCRYQTPSERLVAVSAAYDAKVRSLMEETYSTPDYSTPTPTSSICTTNGKTWRKPLDD